MNRGPGGTMAMTRGTIAMNRGTMAMTRGPGGTMAMTSTEANAFVASVESYKC